MRKLDELRGVGQVYRFTLAQHVKNRANIISVVIMLVISMAMVPVASLMMGGANLPSEDIGLSPSEDPHLPDAGEWEITEVCLWNESTYDVIQQLSLPDSVRVHALTGAMSEDEIGALAPTALYAHVYFSEESLSYRIETYTAETSTLKSSEIQHLTLCILNALEEARTLNFTAQEREWLMLVYQSTVESGDVNKVLSNSEGNEDVGFETSFAVEYIYAILLLMLTMMSSSFIIRAIVEEKSSKLIDLLIVSVKPLALLCGKILAMMTVVFGTLVLLASGIGLSTAVTNIFMDTAVIGGGLEGMGISLSMLNLGWGTAIIVLISLVLSYLTYAIMSGIAGASCSSMTDIEAATMSVTFTVLSSYIVSCVVAAVPNRIVAIVTSLVPFVSAFCAPVHYVCGRIGLPILILSWLIQAAVVLCLARVGAAVYRDLIMYQGKRVRLREIFKMMKKTRGGAANEA